MNWNSQAEVHYIDTGCPFSTTGGFMEFFEGLAYEHANFIFADSLYSQESVYPSMNVNAYKFGSSDCGNTSHYDYYHTYENINQAPRFDESRRQSDDSSTITNNPRREGSTNRTSQPNPIERPRNHSSHDFQVSWEDNVDPDRMTYEELLELGEAVGTQNRGLSKELLALLPVSKYKCRLFQRKRSRERIWSWERKETHNQPKWAATPYNTTDFLLCVVCQMEYKRGDRQITLPCKHAYHRDCGTKWLGINKACPICYTEVFSNRETVKKL